MGDAVGSSSYAGTILSDYLGGAANPNETGGHIGPVSIGRDVLGGSDTAAGTIISESGRLGNVTIGGSLLAGSANRSAHVHSNLEMGAVSIGGNVVGGIGNQSGQIETMSVMGNVQIGGSLIGGAGEDSGQVTARFTIGTVTVGGDWIASSLVAGAQAGADGQFGTQDDVKFSGPMTKDVAGVFSRINSVTIGGQVIGTELGGDHFGIVAESVGSLSVGANLIPLLAGKHNDNILLAPLIDGFFGDLRLNEI